MNTCPHCGSRIDKVGIDQLANIRLSIVRRTILNGLVRAYPGGLSNDEVRKAGLGLARAALCGRSRARPYPAPSRRLSLRLENPGTLTTRPKQKPYRLEPARD